MVGANLERLVPSHHESCLAILLVLEQSDITSTSLLPLPRATVELEQLGAHLERDLFPLFIGRCVNFLGQTDDRLELRVVALLDLLLVILQSYQNVYAE